MEQEKKHFKSKVKEVKKYLNRWTVISGLTFSGLIILSGEVAISQQAWWLKPNDLGSFRLWNFGIATLGLYAGGSGGYLMEQVWDESRPLRAKLNDSVVKRRKGSKPVLTKNK